MPDAPAMLASYGGRELVVTGRDDEGRLLVWHDGRERVAEDLVIDGHRLEDVSLAPVVVGAAPGIVAAFGVAQREDREVVWAPPVVAWRVDRIGSYVEAIIARDNDDGAGTISDVPPLYRFLGFRPARRGGET